MLRARKVNGRRSAYGNSRLLCLLAMCLAMPCSLAQQSQQPIPPLAETVVVVGSLAPVTQGESARTVTVLDTQQHRLAYQQLEDYLRSDSSIDIQQRAPAGIMSGISVRGASFEQTLVLLNGLRMDNVETSHFNLDLPVPLAPSATSMFSTEPGRPSTAQTPSVEWPILSPGSRKQIHCVSTRGWAASAKTSKAFSEPSNRRLWSEVLAGSREFSTGFIADRDYQTEDASTETRTTSRLGKKSSAEAARS